MILLSMQLSTFLLVQRQSLRRCLSLVSSLPIVVRAVYVGSYFVVLAIVELVQAINL